MWNQALATPLGALNVTWSHAGLYSITFAATESVHETRSPTLSGDSPAPIQSLAVKFERALAEYFASGEFNWQLEDCDWTGVSAFHRQVLKRCFAIPAGETLSYGELAAQAGSPKAARAVGGAMARNRWPLVIPCHRVMGSTGKLIGYSGVGGTETKRWLLAFESRCVNHVRANDGSQLSLEMSDMSLTT